MNNKLKIVLSYIGVALLGAVSSIGVLFGVSSCSQQHVGEDKEFQQQLNAPKMNARITSGVLDRTKTYYVVAKNATSNGNGVFYQDSISLANSAMTGTTSLQYNFKLDVSLIKSSNTIYDNVNFVMNSALNGGVYKLSSVYLDGVGGIYNANAGTFNRDLCGFLFTNARLVSGDIVFLYRFFEVYELQNDTFTLNGDINPYTWWNTAKDSPYVSYVTFESGQSSPIKTINMPKFLVGGLAFDKIRFYYSPVSSGQHFNVNGEQFIYTGDSNSYMTFNYASYYNSATKYELAFYEHEITFGAYGYNGPTLQCSYNWTNLQIKTIQFFETPSQSVLNSLNDLNNTYQSVGYSSSTDIGLGNVFQLLSLAFASWVPILSIQIVPGVTIGLLMFLPLISGIIVLVIWIVKR